MRTVLVLSVLLLAVAGGWMAHAWLGRSAASSTDTEANSVRVVRGRLEQHVKARGIVKPAPNALLRIGFPMPREVWRRISRLPWVEGDEVKAGALLARLDCADLQASHAQLTAEALVAERRLAALRRQGPLEIRTSEATHAQAKALLDLAQRTHDRLTRLVQEDAASTKDLDGAVSNLAVARARLEQSTAAVEQVKARVETDVATLEAQFKLAQVAFENVAVQIRWCTLRAPLDAVIFGVHQQQGELTNNTPGAPVLTLLDPNAMQVHLYVDENDVGRIRVGQLVRLRVEAHPDRTVEGKIVRLLPRALLQENVVYYLAVVEPAAEHKKLLRAEMTTLATIQAEVKERVLWLPTSALRSRSDGWYVKRRESGETLVRIGWKTEGKVEIVEGLVEGDEVLVGQ